MGYNTLPYLVLFLPLSLIVYQVSGRKFRKYVLLIASWIYFFLCSRELILYLLLTSAGVWLAGLAMDRAGNRKHLKTCLVVVSAGGLFGILLYLKYTNFFINTVN